MCPIPRDGLCSEKGLCPWKRKGRGWASFCPASLMREFWSNWQDKVRDKDKKPRGRVGWKEWIINAQWETVRVWVRKIKQNLTLIVEYRWLIKMGTYTDIKKMWFGLVREVGPWQQFSSGVLCIKQENKTNRPRFISPISSKYSKLNVSELFTYFVPLYFSFFKLICLTQPHSHAPGMCMRLSSKICWCWCCQRLTQGL